MIREDSTGRAPRADEQVQLAAFRIGGEEYAIDIMRIKEIIQPLKITKVPKAPPFIEGVVELRGTILPIVDLRKRFDVDPAPASRALKYMIVALDGCIIGLVVDAVSEVVRVPKRDVRPAPELDFAGSSVPFFSGVCHVGDRIIMILDLDQILTRQERIDLGVLGAARRDAAAKETR
jgi:purine-binding chemotaxis protein CheW